MSSKENGQHVLAAGGNLLSSQQLSREGLIRILDLARLLDPVAKGEKTSRILEGAQLGNLFFEPSTRSRISFGAAFGRLGGTILDTTGMGITSLSKGESLADTARVVSGYVDIVVLRHPAANAASAFAAASLVPVINGGDGDGEHPTQALTDLFTASTELEKRGKTIDGARIAIVGDLCFGRTTHSLMLTLAQFENVRFALLSPANLSMPRSYVDYALRRGHEVVFAKSMSEALDGADVIYMTRYQTERYGSDADLPALAAGMRLNAETVSRHAPAGTVIMHPLPRSSDFGELSTDLDRSPGLAIFRQTDNGVPIRMAVFCTMFGLETQSILASFSQPKWMLRKRSDPDARA